MTTAPSSSAERQVIRDVEAAELQDLIDHPPHATLAFVDGDDIELVPVRACAGGDLYYFGLRPAAAPPLENREVVLLIDDGQYWFDLRGLSVRGSAERSTPPSPPGGDGLAWYAVVPRRVLAWDYGTLREE